MNYLRSGKIPFSAEEIRSYIDRTARSVVQYLIDEKKTVSAAESCTGGLLSSAITSVPGASKVFECGVVSYSERIKEKLLGVPLLTIEKSGVVSGETADAMAKGVMMLSGSDISVGITGLAGPASADDTLPVGTIYVSVKYKDKTVTENLKLYELGQFDRDITRLLTVGCALELVSELLKEGKYHGNA